MSYVEMDARPVDFILCQYENSKNLFRGPKKSYNGLYGVCLGGADTFGGQVPDPFSSMIERTVGIPILNLGAQHSGAGFYIEDDDILKIIENAHIILIEAPSVVNQSNPYYRVHPRRNDRFVTALAPLYELFPEADFVECHFTKHLITKLITLDAIRADIVFRALQSEWIRNLTMMRSRWNAQKVIHWYNPKQTKKPVFEFPVADSIGFDPQMYPQVLQVQDCVVSIPLDRTRKYVTQSDHQQIGRSLMDALA